MAEPDKNPSFKIGELINGKGLEISFPAGGGSDPRKAIAFLGIRSGKADFITTISLEYSDGAKIDISNGVNKKGFYDGWSVPAKINGEFSSLQQPLRDILALLTSKEFIEAYNARNSYNREQLATSGTDFASRIRIDHGLAPKPIVLPQLQNRP